MRRGAAPTDYPLMAVFTRALVALVVLFGRCGDASDASDASDGSRGGDDELSSVLAMMAELNRTVARASSKASLASSHLTEKVDVAQTDFASRVERMEQKSEADATLIELQEEELRKISAALRTKLDRSFAAPDDRFELELGESENNPVAVRATPSAQTLRGWLAELELEHAAPVLTRDGFSSLAAIRAPHTDARALEAAVSSATKRPAERAALSHAVTRLRSVVLCVRVAEAFDLPRSRAFLRPWQWALAEPPIVSVRATWLATSTAMSSSTTPSQTRRGRKQNRHAAGGAPVQGFHARWGNFDGGRWSEGYMLSFPAIPVDEVGSAKLRLELIVDRRTVCGIEIDGDRLSWQPLPPHSYALDGCDAVVRAQPWLRWLSQVADHAS